MLRSVVSSALLALVLCQATLLPAVGALRLFALAAVEKKELSAACQTALTAEIECPAAYGSLTAMEADIEEGEEDAPGNDPDRLFDAPLSFYGQRVLVPEFPDDNNVTASTFCQTCQPALLNYVNTIETACDGVKIDRIDELVANVRVSARIPCLTDGAGECYSYFYAIDGGKYYPRELLATRILNGTLLPEQFCSPCLMQFAWEWSKTEHPDNDMFADVSRVMTTMCTTDYIRAAATGRKAVIEDHSTLDTIVETYDAQCGPANAFQLKCPGKQCCSAAGKCGTLGSMCTAPTPGERGTGCISGFGACSRDIKTTHVCGAYSPALARCPVGQCCSKDGICGTDAGSCTLGIQDAAPEDSDTMLATRRVRQANAATDSALALWPTALSTLDSAFLDTARAELDLTLLQSVVALLRTKRAAPLSPAVVRMANARQMLPLAVPVAKALLAYAGSLSLNRFTGTKTVLCNRFGYWSHTNVDATKCNWTGEKWELPKVEPQPTLPWGPGGDANVTLPPADPMPPPQPGAPPPIARDIITIVSNGVLSGQAIYPNETFPNQVLAGDSKLDDLSVARQWQWRQYDASGPRYLVSVIYQSVGCLTTVAIAGSVVRNTMCVKGSQQQQWTQSADNKLQLASTKLCVSFKTDGRLYTVDCGQADTWTFAEGDAPVTQPTAPDLKYGQVVNPASKRCLGVATNGASIVTVVCQADIKAQTWALDKITGYMHIGSAPRACLAVGSLAAFQPVILRLCQQGDDPTSQWSLVKNGTNSQIEVLGNRGLVLMARGNDVVLAPAAAAKNLPGGQWDFSALFGQ
ncbi:hypothetical protein HDU89_007161 [Geranomyces variabilis]|nr:hypothetical protein HDU89_007161 [Geranomyces variabilis]